MFLSLRLRLVPAPHCFLQLVLHLHILVHLVVLEVELQQVPPELADPEVKDPKAEDRGEARRSLNKIVLLAPVLTLISVDLLKEVKLHKLLLTWILFQLNGEGIVASYM